MPSCTRAGYKFGFKKKKKVTVPHGGEREKKKGVFIVMHKEFSQNLLLLSSIMIVTDILFPHRGTPSDTDIVSVTPPSQSRNPSLLILPRYPSSISFYILPGHSNPGPDA